MTFSLTPEQQAWIAARITQGDFSTMEQAARQLIDERIAERASEARDDFAWARTDIDEALSEVARGEVVSLEEHEARMDAVLAALKG